MRWRQFNFSWVIVGFLVVSSSGCGGKDKDSGSAGSGDKLKKEILGTWANDNTFIYKFNDDGTFEFKEVALNLNGKYKVLDERNIEVTFDLDEAGVVLKQVEYDSIKNIYEIAAKIPNAKIEPFDLPEPKKGENRVKHPVAVQGDELTLRGVKYKKSVK